MSIQGRGCRAIGAEAMVRAAAWSRSLTLVVPPGGPVSGPSEEREDAVNRDPRDLLVIVGVARFGEQVTRP